MSDESGKGCDGEQNCMRKLMVRSDNDDALAIFTIEVPFEYCCEDNNPEVWGDLIQRIVERHLDEIRKEVSDFMNLDAKMCEYYKNRNIIPQ
jgi:hypothetical protein